MSRLIAIFLLVAVTSVCHADSRLAVQAQQQDSAGSGDLVIKTLFKANVCGGVAKSQWLTSQPDYEAAFQSSQQHIIGGTTPQLTPVDFSQNNVLLLSMGQQRTGGYGLDLANQQMRINNGIAVIEVQWQEPKSGMMLIQMLTNPCIFVEVPRGGYREIKVLDQAGQLRESISLN